MFMIRVKVPLQISRGIFLYGEIIQMHTLHESNHTGIKLPRNDNSKEKKIKKNQKTIQFMEVIKHN